MIQGYCGELRCPYCGYKPVVIPDPFNAYEQAQCLHLDTHRQLDKMHQAFIRPVAEDFLAQTNRK